DRYADLRPDAGCGGVQGEAEAGRALSPPARHEPGVRVAGPRAAHEHVHERRGRAAGRGRPASAPLTGSGCGRAGAGITGPWPNSTTPGLATPTSWYASR